MLVMNAYVFGMDTQPEQNMILNCAEKRINRLKFVDFEVNVFLREA